MNKLLPLLFIIAAAIGCKSEPNRKLVLLDSLKKAYAGKEVSLTFSNNTAGTDPLTAQYAYTERKGGDLAFKLNTEEKYKVATEEEFIFVPTTERPTLEHPEMVLIETLRGDKKGFVSYKYISEFRDVTFYDIDK